MTEPLGLGPEPERIAQGAGTDPHAPVWRLAERFLRERVDPAVHGDATDAQVTAWHAPGEPVPFAEAVGQPHEPFSPGAAWGRPWSTTWFRMACDLSGFAPDDRVELVVDLGFTGAQPGFQAEGLAYTDDGRVLKGVAPRNRAVPLPRDADRVVVHVEAAANPDVAGDFRATPTPLGDPATAGDEPLYVFRGAKVAVLRPEVWELQQDLAVLLGLADVLPDSDRRAAVLAALGRAVAALDPDDVPGTASAGRAALAPVLAVPATGTHRITAVGHAHIDSAWLWPFRETVRKCARTFANVLDLMDRDDRLVFACSSAQQYAWIEQHQPALFARIRQRVAEGRWVPVGGMWVESDTNMPGGESLVRQFTAGKRWFLDRFGVEPREVWLPDSFGYTAALPQIAEQAGCRYLLTQKTSWNDTNPMPHHSFSWEGLDGTRILTHFPPVETYNSDLSPQDLARAERVFRDKGDHSRSLVPFGWGDGGGGPTREMLAAADRARSLAGLPEVAIAPPSAFFEALEAETPHPPVWSGEIYLELHRGTFSSQARTKAGNRRSEALLHQAELWSTTAAVLRGAPYPAEALEAVWRTALLLQFHDVLPGSSIAWVHREAESEHARVQAVLEGLIGDALRVLAGPGERALAANAAPAAQGGVAPGALGAPPPVEVEPALLRREGDVVSFSNAAWQVEVRDGQGITGLLDRLAARQVVPDGGRFAQLQLFRDLPNRWDAWDLDRSYRDLPLPAPEPRVESAAVDDDGAAVVVLRSAAGRSRFVQTMRLPAGDGPLRIEVEVDWQDRRRVLKLAFPVDVVSPSVAAETQFGHVLRPTHENTSWERARFEFPAHRWVRLADAGWGVAVTNDRVYGHDAFADLDAAGRRVTVVRQTLLRGATFPDPHADEGAHRFVAEVVAGDVLAAVHAGRRLALPLREVRGGGPVAPLVSVEGAVLETVKPADDGSGDVVVRVSEALGARTCARLTCAVPLRAAMRTDLLERPVDDGALDPSDVRVDLGPFRIATIRLVRA